jgi:phage-related protein
MATFTYIPDRPASEASQPRVNQVRFGAYEQRVISGINPFRDTWTLKFANRSAADITAIVAFLKARDGLETFEWTTPFSETAQFICTDWAVILESCNYSTVNAQFELRYEPGATNLVTPSGTATTFTWIPDFTADQKYQANTQAFSFGDGYTKRVKLGLNAQTETWNLQLRNRTNTERDEIRTFLKQARGQSAFAWVDPASGISGKYVCSEWSTTFNQHNNNDIQASFRKVFEP